MTASPSPLRRRPREASPACATCTRRSRSNQSNPGIGFRDDGLGSCAGSWDVNFCPDSRDDSPPSTTELGVYVEISYRPITNLIPGPTFSIDERAVFAVEPCIPGLGVAC